MAEGDEGGDTVKDVVTLSLLDQLQANEKVVAIKHK